MNAAHFPQPLVNPKPDSANSSRSNQQPVRRAARLSARQLLEIELGLFLLTELLPTAPPDALPLLLSGLAPAHRPDWTPRQHKYLDRARVLLGHFRHRAAWQTELERYRVLRNPLRQAYDIGEDRSWFSAKSVGFFRNRILMLKQAVG